MTLDRKAAWDESRREELDLLVQQGLSRRVEVLGRLLELPRASLSASRSCPQSFCAASAGQRQPLGCDQHGLEMTISGRDSGSPSSR